MGADGAASPQLAVLVLDASVERILRYASVARLSTVVDKVNPLVDFSLILAATLVVVRQLIQRARFRYCWAGCPMTRRLK